MGFFTLLNFLILTATQVIYKKYYNKPSVMVKLENYYAKIENVSVSFPKITTEFKLAKVLHYQKEKHTQKPIYKDVFLANPPLKPKDQKFIESGTTIKYSYAVFKNVCVNAYSTFGYKRFLFFKRQNTRHFSPIRFIKKSGNVTHICKEFVLAGGQLARMNFGHMLIDAFSPMLLIPEEVRNRAYVFCPIDKPLYKEGLLLIGFKERNIIPVDDDEWIQTYAYHTIMNPLPLLCYYGKCCRLFHQLIVDKYNLSNVKNDQYVFCNRDKGYCRHITNMEELLNHTRLTYPQYDWKMLKDSFPTLKETFTNWIKIKFIFLPTGSNANKCIALKPGSVMVVASSGDGLDTSTMRMICSSDVFNIWFWVPGMEHFGDKNKPNFVNVTDAMKSIDIGIYAAAHQRLPNGK